MNCEKCAKPMPIITKRGDGNVKMRVYACPDCSSGLFAHGVPVDEATCWTCSMVPLDLEKHLRETGHSRKNDESAYQIACESLLPVIGCCGCCADDDERRCELQHGHEGKHRREDENIIIEWVDKQ